MARFALVDAFTHEPFAGNPAGVVVLDRAADEGWMQRLAGEVGASETAFLHAEGARRWRLRWFTPTTEVDLCGHATLASAHVLFGAGLADGEVAFTTRAGTLTARRDDAGVTIELPARPPRPRPAPPGLETALAGREHTYLGCGDAADGHGKHVALLADEAAVASVAVDLDAVAGLGEQGLVVTAPGDEVDVVARYFAPTVGVDEDPVTGSAFATIVPWWAERLGRTTLRCRQRSSRGGELTARLSGERVALTGGAVTVVAGEVTPPRASAANVGSEVGDPVARGSTTG